MSHNSGNARRILLDAFFNCRDLGGYPCAGGKTTQFGRFIRCGIPFGPMGPDRAAAGRNSGETVIRPTRKRRVKGCTSAYAKEPDIVYHHYTLLEINPAYVEKVWFYGTRLFLRHYSGRHSGKSGVYTRRISR